MRYVIVGVALALAGCAAEGPATKAHAAYQACLAQKPADQCQNEKASFEAAVEYANAVSRRAASAGPIVVPAYSAPAVVQTQPSPRLNCITTDGLTTCY
jgi:hypothetical protein